MKPTHLRFSLQSALIEKEKGHPADLLKELKITYQLATSQSICDQWWFWNCENLPSTLPNYLEVADWNPMEQIGNGLSLEEAEIIRDYNATN